MIVRNPSWRGTSLRGLGDDCTPTVTTDPTTGQPLVITPASCGETLTVTPSGASLFQNPAAGQTIFTLPPGGSSGLLTPTNLILGASALFLVFAFMGGRR